MTRLEFLQHKIVDLEHAVQRIEGWRLNSSDVVFTNGCFDILHKGHVTYLAQAAELGNRLVVGVNTDSSVKRQGKGNDRPVNGENARATVLASLSCVDLVVLFDDDTPHELINQIKPNVLVKGADYDPNEKNPNAAKYIVGSKEVLANGGRVEAIPFVEGFSTTSVIQKLKG